MRVFLTPSAALAVRSLPPSTNRRIKKAIVSLPDDPLGHKRLLDVKKLVGHVETVPLSRLRVGDWRAVFRIAKDRIEVIRVFPRSEGYGWMERLGF